MTSTATEPTSLATAAARNLATTTKTAPQMQAITPRWLLRVLPWVEATGGTYRVNRRLAYPVGTGQVSFAVTGDDIRVVAPTLAELPGLRNVDVTVLEAIADRFTQVTYLPGEVVTRHGEPADQLILIAHGKVATTRPGKYGDTTKVATLADGGHLSAPGTWPTTATAVTPTITLVLPRATLAELGPVEPDDPVPHHNKHGEASIHLSSGHAGEPSIIGTFVDYELSPRQYELSLAQTVLRIHSRVADLYNEPHDQTEHQLRLTVEALRERQEDELLNNPDFGLLHNADLAQRIPTKSGPPTPDDMDNLLARRKKTQFFLAHPLAVAAFGRECNARGIYPAEVTYDGKAVRAWRGVPLLPCDKIPVTGHHTTSIIAMRTGEDNQGVVGLRQTGLPDEYEPGVSVRFMDVNEQAVISYLVTAYHSAAILVPDALGVLEHVEVGR